MNHTNNHFSALPFIIGVSGHRDLNPNKELEVKIQIREALDYWLQQLDIATPLWVMTGLAAGADTWATEVALEMKITWGSERIQIKACLPMPLENYRHDFQELVYASNAEAHLNELVETLSLQGQEIFVLPNHLSPEQQAIALADSSYGTERNAFKRTLT